MKNKPKVQLPGAPESWFTVPDAPKTTYIPPGEGIEYPSDIRERVGDYFRMRAAKPCKNGSDHEVRTGTEPAEHQLTLPIGKSENSEP